MNKNVLVPIIAFVVLVVGFSCGGCSLLSPKNSDPTKEALTQPELDVVSGVMTELRMYREPDGPFEDVEAALVTLGNPPVYLSEMQGWEPLFDDWAELAVLVEPNHRHAGIRATAMLWVKTIGNWNDPILETE